MSRLGLSLKSYLKVTQAAFVALYVIIVSGSLVRLTGSGLGCVDWPACNSSKFVDVSSTHAAIEQLNRLFTGVVTVAVMAAVGMSLLLKPRVRNLTLLSWGLVAGVLAQIVIGGVVVLTGLNPYSNMLHFLVSIVLITNAVVLNHRVHIAIDGIEKIGIGELSAATLRLRWLLIASCGVAIVLGTIVTGAGPHAGDENAIRLGIDIGWSVRFHSASVWVCLLSALWLAYRIKQNPREWQSLGQALQVFLFWCIFQGALGYLQYFSGVPVPLVALHVAGSVAVWISALRLKLI
jgi:cytochrome c oxidase assembly protein subunit 15